MKTIIDLPEVLVGRMKLKAVHKGRKLKDVVADLLNHGLNSGKTKSSPTKAKDYLLSAPASASAQEMTPERIRQILEGTP